MNEFEKLEFRNWAVAGFEPKRDEEAGSDASVRESAAEPSAGRK